MSRITTHVLDTARGRPADGVPICLEIERVPAQWTRLGQGATDADGRLRTLMPSDLALVYASYRLVFDTGAYFEAQSCEVFFPHVVITFVVHDPTQHFHVPLLLSPFGYSTYRGS